ncbi:ABC transporter substrate-binding protein [Eubacteriaceae bacterium ES2]|nr:ABC transporter substrate-binding protein [Eubacteriaceae bacterium ES2]
MKKIISFVLIVSLMGMLVTGCETASGGNDDGKHLNVGIYWLGTDLDPASDYNGWSLSRTGIAETLTKLDENIEVETCLADSWERLNDLTWTFHIRDGVTFQNGNPLTAEAVKNCFERTFAKNSRASTYFKLDQMIADGQNLTIITSEPCGALLNNLVEPIFSVIDVSVDEAMITNTPVGTGPYAVTDFVSELSAECVKYADYWDGEPGLDSISYQYIKDPDSRAMALQSGEIDLAQTIPQASMSLFEDENDYQISEVTGLRGATICMNFNNPVLSDLAVRQAISTAIDKEKYAELTNTVVATGLFSTALPFGSDQLQDYSYDPEKAAQILEQAGYVDSDGDAIRESKGEKIHLKFYLDTSGGVAAILAQAIQADLKNIGIEVELIQSENLSDIKKSGNFDMFYNGSNAAPTGDPQAYLSLAYQTGGVSNYGNYSSVQMDKLIGQLNQTFEIEKRQQLAEEASQLLLTDAANLFISYTPSNIVATTKVKNFQASPADYYLMTKDITIE